MLKKIEPDKIANDTKNVRKNTNKLSGILLVGILSYHRLSWSADFVILCCLFSNNSILLYRR